MVKLNDVLYIPQSVKNIMSILRLVAKGATMGATKDRMTIKKNGINIIMDKLKGK